MTVIGSVQMSKALTEVEICHQEYNLSTICIAFRDLLYNTFYIFLLKALSGCFLHVRAKRVVAHVVVHRVAVENRIPHVGRACVGSICAVEAGPQTS